MDCWHLDCWADGKLSETVGTKLWLQKVTKGKSVFLLLDLGKSGRGGPMVGSDLLRAIERHASVTKLDDEIEDIKSS